jgi:putative transport protein
MPTWLTQLFTASSVAQSIVLYAIVIAVGIALYKLRITGIFPGATGVLFMGISFLPYVVMRIIASKFFRKTYFEICGLLAGACTDPPALSFALKMAGNDIPSGTYATVYPQAMILRILVAQLLILFFA